MLEGSFELEEPTTGETPVIVEAPHAGLWLDAESANWTIAPARSIARDADLYVDELFKDAAARGATYLYARLSRYVVDLNRAHDDYDGVAVVGGQERDRPRGVIWRLSSDSLPVLRDAITQEEYQRRIRQFYRPYHDTLGALIERKRKRFGFAVVLCAHSMPSPRRRARAVTPTIADIVPGTRGRTSAADVWIDLVDETARSFGWDVRHDVPYRGGFTTGHYGQPARGVHVVQLEIARRLYMNERSLARLDEGFATVSSFAGQLVSALVAAARERAPAPIQPAHGTSA